VVIYYETKWRRGWLVIVTTSLVFDVILLYFSRFRPGSSVGIATDYGLDGVEIESRSGRDFSHTSRPALRLTQPPVQWVPGLSPGVKRPGRGAVHPPLLAPRLRMSRAIPLLTLWALGGLSKSNL
jgi:hypothetical protein